MTIWHTLIMKKTNCKIRDSKNFILIYPIYFLELLENVLIIYFLFSEETYEKM